MATEAGLLFGHDRTPRGPGYAAYFAGEFARSGVTSEGSCLPGAVVVLVTLEIRSSHDQGPTRARIGLSYGGWTYLSGRSMRSRNGVQSY